MSLPIEWTPLALQSLSDIFEYTFEFFGEQQLLKLRTQVTTAAKRIAIFPLSGKKEEYFSKIMGVEYRSTMVINEIKMIYTILDDKLIIEYMMNTRQDEDTIAQKLK